MTLQRVVDDGRTYGARMSEIWYAMRSREGLPTIVAVVVISALLIIGLSYVFEAPPG
jgi:hypothetical protein